MTSVRRSPGNGGFAPKGHGRAGRAEETATDGLGALTSEVSSRPLYPSHPVAGV